MAYSYNLLPSTIATLVTISRVIQVLLHWQIAVILIAIILVAPSLMVLRHSNTQRPWQVVLIICHFLLKRFIRKPLCGGAASVLLFHHVVLFVDALDMDCFEDYLQKILA